MSYCKSEGKDKIIFVTKEDQKTPSSLTLEEYSDGEPGLIREDGSINWNCPCLGGMATGPCGFEFRAAFSCFHNSTEDPKGSECFDDFRRMQECMVSYPSLYDDSKSDDKDEDLGDVFANAEAEGGSEQRGDSERVESTEVKDKDADTTSTDSNKTSKVK